MKKIVVTARMIKRVRELGYRQDRRAECLICRTKMYDDCEHSWYEVQKVCDAIRAFDGKDVQIEFDV